MIRMTQRYPSTFSLLSNDPSLSPPPDQRFQFLLSTQNVTGQIDHFARSVDDGCIAGSHCARESNENLLGDPDGHGVPWKVLFLHPTPYFQGQLPTPAARRIKEEESLTGLRPLQDI